MASSASSSPAGAESAPPVQVSAAPPPYLWLPARRGRAGGPGRGAREPEGRARAGAPPGALLSWGCRAEPARRPEGTGSLRPLGVRLRPRARDRSCGPGQRRELAVRPGARASEHPGEGGREGPNLRGSRWETFVQRKSAARGSGRPRLGLPSLGFCVLGSPLRLRARLNRPQDTSKVGCPRWQGGRKSPGSESYLQS